MDELNHELRALIKEVCQHPKPSRKRSLALNALLKKVQTLPGIITSSHQDYPEALNITWAWVCQNVDRFNIDTLTLAEDLKKWINSYLYWRIHDLKSTDQVYWKKHISLSMPISSGEDANSVTQGDLLPTTQYPFRSDKTDFNLKPIDRLIEQIESDLDEKLIEYIKQDPEKKLRQCYPKNYPECNSQFLTIQLFLQEIPVNFRYISKKKGIKYSNLIYHWQKKCLPLLRKIAQELYRK
ncbi:hypothetical protein G7B40_031355 [Aetokthonos hydrillicola Thurmond2011]|uniref:Sigma-70 family RNA polymerase sigma factor n=1 Tax=Aetokthonos hydrillicola Thurmond2011 TaxID=2712845 RepID=A0AAP5IG13_9CYAN|nr:hypothetical protein [Aetokthonos hydrillicola]MBO3463370.1 hypothetical protein [Aetokthonos hydrillicola CCALA 1050]MBW4590503.1 hypothetical protein [Aetokthonos hydrillicola CCALA 1050]MDR9899023.1 hypothetical protein [Aetokthonos hydrillicola Thurmond2011]